MKKILCLFTIFLIFFSVSGCNKKQSSKQNKVNITISAAASLRDALKEIKEIYEKKNSISIDLNLGSSGALQKQIEQGASSDLFISAGVKQMDNLQKKNLIVNDSRKNLLKNDLVLIVSKDFKSKIKNINDIKKENVKIGIGEPNSVPAGQYAKEALVNLNLWDDFSSKFVYGKDVTQIANYVERGEAAVGIVYKSDCIPLKNATILETFDSSFHKPIVYPMAIINSSKNKGEVNKFIDFLNSQESKTIFKKYGFQI